jgi:hypothetical protein
MPKGSNTLDLTGGFAENGVYDMPGSCGNCAWTGTLVLRKGNERPHIIGVHRDTRATCPNCGCRTVSARA